MGQPVRQHAGGCGGVRAIMVQARELADGAEEFGREDQRGQAFGQSQGFAGAERENAEQFEPDIDRDQRDGDRCEEFQHGGRQESHAQDGHGAVAQLEGGILKAGRLTADPAKRPDQAGLRRAGLEGARQVIKCGLLGFGAGGGLAGGQPDEHRQHHDRHEQQDGGQPALGRDGNQDDHGPGDGEAHAGQPSCGVPFQFCRAVDDLCCAGAGVSAAEPTGPGL